ncbi:hypothetical protein LPW11_04735 [Geomonas sp. RF6]|uniref:hypothetical protein n=1 Tax=Geomonas sp. RF6 TaxID=2897342 RepID=UPI001E3A2B4A|nr:hypothetical protein [Geomonas sp. RF6]UFS71507.1 hypothetical protein LPW11_04735 [Geomonas sp. RF6]
MKLIATLLFSLFLAAPAFAASPDRVMNWSVYGFVDSYNWREYRGGERLLKESGPMLGVGSDLLLNLLDEGNLVVKAKAEMFGSVVDYTGQTQESSFSPTRSKRPVNTDVDYIGSRLEGDVGWRFPLQSVSVEPFGGFGVRWWLRDLNDSTAYDSTGTPFLASGYTESWTSVYATAGVRGTHKSGKNLQFFLEGGVRYPFYVSNEVDVSSVGTITLRPEGQLSGIGEAGVTYKHLRISAHYEGFYVDESPVVSGYLQPKSSSDVYGVRFGWAF